MICTGFAWLLPQVFCNPDVHNYPKSAALGTLGSASQRTTSRLNAARGSGSLFFTALLQGLLPIGAMVLFTAAANQSTVATPERRRAQVTGYVMTDGQELFTAVRWWINSRSSAESTYGHISTWDTSQVPEMECLFNTGTSTTCVAGPPSYTTPWHGGRRIANAENFNDDISAWDTSNVWRMQHMFHGAKQFNQPIGDWNVAKVTSMSYMLHQAKAFNQPLGDWNVAKVTTMTSMFDEASKFNQPLGDWNHGRVTSMLDMFDKAGSFNQDLGWCLKTSVKYWAQAFKGTRCASTRCGVTQRANGLCIWPTPRPTHMPSTRPTPAPTPVPRESSSSSDGGGADIIVVVGAVVGAMLLLAVGALWFYRRKKGSETEPKPKLEPPPDQPEKVGLPGRGWVYTESGTQRLCKHCGQALSQSMFVEKQWKKPRPTCVDCASRLSAQNATVEETSSISTKLTSFFFGEQEETPKEGEETATLPVVAEAEEEATEQPPPPPPPRRWFSRAKPEPAAPETEEAYYRIAAWYNSAECDALRDAWGAYPKPEEFQTWPGFVTVTNAFLDREPEPEA